MNSKCKMFKMCIFLIVSESNAVEIEKDIFKGVPAQNSFFLPLFINEKRFKKGVGDIGDWVEKKARNENVLYWTVIISPKEYKKYNNIQQQKNYWVGKASKKINRPISTKIKAFQLKSGNYRLSIGVAW